MERSLLCGRRRGNDCAKSILYLRGRPCAAGAESEDGIAVGATGEKGAQSDAVSFRGALRGECGGWQSDAVWRKEKSETLMREGMEARGKG